MGEWFSEYGYLIGVLALVSVLFVIIFFKAAKAYSSHFNSVNEQKKQLEYLTALKNKYRSITAEELEKCSDDEILEGTALVIQVDMQKCEDMQGFFRTLPREKQYIYTLDVFVQDGSAKEFFTQNGEILTDIIDDALIAIGMGDFAARICEIKKMYNKDDESVSFDASLVENLDKEINDRCILSEIRHNSAKFIKSNFNLL